MIRLRPYQEEARDAIIRDWETGHFSTLACLATGTGKTEIALGTLAAEREAGRATRILALAHRRELIHQPRERIQKHWTHSLPVPGVVMAAEREVSAEFVTATVQSLYGERLAEVLAHGAFSHVWIDEAHRSVSATYMTLISQLRALNPNLRLLGVTATPKRTDKVGLKKLYQSVAYRIGIRDAIRLGALVPFTAIAVELPVDFSEVPQTKGEDGGGWDEEIAGQVMSTANAEEIIVETWQKQASDRQTIAFTSSVAQAHSLAAAFRAAGVAAAAVDGETPTQQRAETVARYKAGDLQMLVNCFVYVEGFDAPETSCVLMAKPTKSDLIYVQCAGRGLRLAAGKTDCLILDFAPMNARDMRMAGDLLGKPREVRKKEQKAKDAGAILDCFGINGEGEGIDGDPDEVRLRVLDFFSASKLAWTFDGGLATVSVGPKAMLAVVLPQKERVAKAEQLRAAGNWRPDWEAEYQRISGYQVWAIEDNRRASLLGLERDWEGASYLAEDWAGDHAEGWASGRGRRWRHEPAQEKQRALCQRFGVWRDGMTRGQASQAITHYFAQRALQQKGVVR